MREVAVNCPDEIHVQRHPSRRPDRRRKLSVNPAKNVAHCWSCGFATRNAQALIEQHGITLPGYVEWGEVLTEEQTKALQLPAEYSVDWPANPRAYQYLLRRGLSPVTIAGYGLGFCLAGQFAGRIIIPVTERGTLVNFQARDYTGLSELRYTGPGRRDGAHPSCLFNLDRAGKTGVVVLVEGPFDALRLPEFAVGTLGKNWNALKRNKLLAYRPHTVLIALDEDGTAEGDSEVVQASLTGLVATVHRLRLGGKDLGAVPAARVQQIRELCQAFADLPPAGPRGD